MNKNGKNTALLSLISFIALMIVALLMVINNVLPLIGVNVTGTLFSLLDTIKNVLILLVIGIHAYRFVVNKKKAYKVFYWIAIALFLVGIVLAWF